MTKTLLEMSNLQVVARNEHIQLGPMVEEILTDLVPLAEKGSVTLEREGDSAITGSDTLIYRLLFNLTENAIKYNRPGGSVRVSVFQAGNDALFAFPTPVAVFRRNTNAVSSSLSFEWTSLVAENTAVQDWGFLWCWRSRTFTAAPYGWRKARRAAPPLR